MNEQCWLVKVYDAETSTTTTLSKYGELDNIKRELEEEGYWQFVSARLEE